MRKMHKHVSAATNAKLVAETVVAKELGKCVSAVTDFVKAPIHINAQVKWKHISDMFHLLSFYDLHRLWA
jgi:hypothetical protein